MISMRSILNQIYRYAFVSQGSKFKPNVSSSFQRIPFGYNIGANLGFFGKFHPVYEEQSIYTGNIFTNSRHDVTSN